MPGEPQSRSRRSKSHAVKLVESTNSLTCVDFFARYAPQDLPVNVQSTTNTTSVASRTYENASTITKQVLEQCLDLIEQTSADDYKHSESGWSRSKKKKEMKLPDMKYIIFSDALTGIIAGFVSFMVTYEDGCEVVYVYEIHLTPEWQGQGLGKIMMNGVESAGRSVGVEKIMLTVFKANQRAVGWYQNMGYVEDEYSPAPRKLRNGTVKEPTYIILSKSLKD